MPSTVPTPDHDPAAVTAALRQRERLQEIADLELLSPEVAALLQDVARDAATHFGLPIGLVSVVLDEAQHFAASHGLGGWLAEVNGTPVEWSFCRYAVSSGTPFVVEDAEAHPLVQESPLVQIDGVRCYAGIPLVTSKGHVVGSFCVIGTTDRSFDDAELATLKQYAAEAIRRIEARRPVAA